MYYIYIRKCTHIYSNSSNGPHFKLHRLLGSRSFFAPAVSDHPYVLRSNVNSLVAACL